MSKVKLSGNRGIMGKDRESYRGTGKTEVTRKGWREERKQKRTETR